MVAKQELGNEQGKGGMRYAFPPYDYRFLRLAPKPFPFPPDPVIIPQHEQAH
jgi:hypothetical protein